MAKAIKQLSSGLTIGIFSLGSQNGVKSVLQQVHDGDTINVSTPGNFGVRFLGVDAPEMSFTLPGDDRFLHIDHPDWTKFLTDPFSNTYPEIALSRGLKKYIKNKIGSSTAVNHHLHAKLAEQELEKEIKKDLEMLNQTTDAFQIFTAFAHEVMDGYGRLLAYVNCNKSTEPRPLDYNGRLLKAGRVNPYLIWPNVNPFRKQNSIVNSVPDPGTANVIATQESTLMRARGWVKQAREDQKGIFEAANPLKIEAFELRFLAGRRAPNRWVIDLSRNDLFLIPPQEYYTIQNTEDRLFIPEEYVPLFQKKGWKKG